jgi:uncharacterized protein (DUF305 family)
MNDAPAARRGGVVAAAVVGHDAEAFSDLKTAAIVTALHRAAIDLADYGAGQAIDPRVRAFARRTLQARKERLGKIVNDLSAAKIVPQESVESRLIERGATFVSKVLSAAQAKERDGAYLAMELLGHAERIGLIEHLLVARDKGLEADIASWKAELEAALVEVQALADAIDGADLGWSDANIAALVSGINRAAIDTAEAVTGEVTDEAVKSRAQNVIADHTQAQADLEAVLTKAGIMPSDTSLARDMLAAERRVTEDLASSTDVDRRFVALMIVRHAKEAGVLDRLALAHVRDATLREDLQAFRDAAVEHLGAWLTLEGQLSPRGS